ncbi:MAG TPA: MmcQ/YjbR family DNA-binding protein [Caulobacteraceae bacterium]|jgi:predicted DNA-binding protein (MmcQ/YjbR family)
MTLGPRAAALQAKLDAKPGAASGAVSAPRGREPLALIYKVGGKTFAILGARADAFVILKCDPHLIEMLKQQYAGVGHRSHLDRRHWISVSLDADVPAAEVERLVDGSYDLVRASLTRKQQAALAGA